MLLLGPREVQGGRVQEGSKRDSNDNWEKSTGASTGDLLELLDFFSKFY